MSENPFVPIQTECHGATASPGTPPLEKPVSVIVVYNAQDGKVQRTDGCNYLQDGRCHADGSSDAPPCLYLDSPQSPAVSDAAASATNLEVNAPVASQSSDHVLAAQPDEVMVGDEGDFLILSDDPTLTTDVTELGEGIEKRLAFPARIEQALHLYEQALIAKGRRPNAGERAVRLGRERGWLFDTPIVHPVRVTLNHGGTTSLELNKQLANGREGEIFRLIYDYETKSGNLQQIVAKFPGSEMTIDFEDNKITHLKLAFGNSGNSATTILTSHGKKDSELDTYIMSVPRGGMPKTTSRTGSVIVDISVKDLTLDIRNDVVIEIEGEKSRKQQGYYDENLGYSTRFSRFITKDNLEGTGGLSEDQFIQLLKDILGLLPFAKAVRTGNKVTFKAV